MEIVNRGNFSRVKYDATGSSLPDFPGFSLIIDIIDVFGQLNFQVLYYVSKTSHLGASNSRHRAKSQRGNLLTRWDAMRNLYVFTCSYF